MAGILGELQRHAHDAAIVITVCNVVLKACNDRTQNRRAFVDAGGMLELHKVLSKYLLDAEVVRLACGAIWSSCLRADNAQAFGAAGGMPELKLKKV